MRFKPRRRGLTVACFALCLLVACFGAYASSGDDSDTTEPAPAEKVMVQAESVERAVEIVETVGGEVTHRLKIIRAVGTALTPEQRLRASKLEGFVRFFEDRTVESASSLISSSFTVRDEFTVLGYAGNAGSNDWAGTNTGNTYLTYSDGSRRLALKEKTTRPDQGIWRQADLLGAASAQVSFIYRRVGNLGRAGID